MSNQQLQDELSQLTVRLCLKGKFGINEAAEKNGLTMMQAMTLCLIDAEDSTRMSTLSTFLCCDPSSVTANVDRLVAAKFIERKESAQDRRTKVLNLTPKGLELRQQLLQVTAEKRLPDLSTLTDTEAQQLALLLKKAAAI